jgi:hypothetical protein
MKAGLVYKKKPILQKHVRQSDNAEGTKDLSNGEGVSGNQRNDTNQNGNGETKTDVLEVWFSGCHTGASLANLAMNNFSSPKIQISAVTKSQRHKQIFAWPNFSPLDDMPDNQLGMWYHFRQGGT